MVKVAAPLSFSSLVELLRHRALEQPDRLSYLFLADGEAEAACLTFDDLDRRARAIGAELERAGGQGERALLLFPPGIEFIAAFFGCLYGGAIAVPAYPPRAAKGQPRLRSIAHDARPRVVLTTAALSARAEMLVTQVPELREAVWLATDSTPVELADEWTPPPSDLDSLAFLQYTSGSTAAPKGVMVSHGNLLHNEETIRLAFGQSAESVIAGWLPLYHDMGLIGNVLQPLYVGARCILMSPIAFLQRPRRWLAAISRYGVTTSGGPNFAYDLCVRKIGEEDRQGLDLSSWQVAFNGAEPVRADTLERFAAAFAPHGFDRRAFFPCYGLAEATLFVTGGPHGALPVVARVEAAALEQGRAVLGAAEGVPSRRLVGSGSTWPGHELRIVDPESALPCPPGRVGEIWVASPSVACGYWNLEAETERSFRAVLAEPADPANPVAAGAGRPYLRTGDLGFLAGGQLFVTGRVKDLIILRGRNLYPQDLELTAERSHPALRAGCGAAFAVDAGDEERLVLVQELERGAEGAAAEAAAAIRRALAEEHEVQAHEIVLLPHDTIPKTSSGKIQRHACRQRYLAGEIEALGRSRAEEPEAAPAEGGERAPGLWRELATDRRGPWLAAYLAGEVARLCRQPAAALDPEQPLTGFGLDSLAAVELEHALAADLGVAVDLSELLAGPTLRQLAATIEERALAGAPQGPEEVPLAPAPEPPGGYPLTHNQRALWFLHRLQPESVAYHIAVAAEIATALDMAALRRALELLARRHEALRLGFFETPAGPVQRAGAERGVELTEEDAAGWHPARLDARLEEIAYRPFDLERDPLLRFAVLKGTPSVVLLVAHHIVVDLWSLVGLVRDLGELYARLRHEPEPLPPTAAPALSFTDYAVWQERRLAGERGELLWAYWRDQLSGAPAISDLPADRPRPPLQTFGGGSRSRGLDAGLLERVKARAGAHRTTLYTLLLAAFDALLYRHGGREDLLVGSPTAGRSPAGLAEMVGLFVNSVVLRSRVLGTLAFGDLVDQVRETALAAFAHQDYPFPLLVERLQPKRDPSCSPLFQVMFSLQRSHLPGTEGLAAFALGEAGVRVEVAGLPLVSRRLGHRAAQFDLELNAAEGGRGLGLALFYNTDLFDPTTAERLLDRFAILLRGAVEDPARSIAELPLLAAHERQQLLADWNDTVTPLDRGRSFPERFAEQARRTPNALAVACGGREMTYAELDAAASRLARGLLAAGLAPEDRVAFWAERGIDFLAGMIAVWKAGGAYLPLDPRQPVRRLVRMVEESGARLVLASPAFRDAAGAALAVAAGAGGPAVLSWAELLAADRSGESLPAGPLPQQLAYLLFTSGSTGVPKGAMIEHRGLANHLWSKALAPLGLGPADRIAQTAAATFDISIWQFLAALLVGGSVHVLPDEVVGDPPRLLAALARSGITILEAVPSLLWALLQEAEPGSHPAADLAALRWVLPTGEALPPELCRRWFAQFPRVPLLNAYGPTECADDVSVHALSEPLPERATRTPIGRPVVNLRLHVLDRDHGLAPVGVPGELAVAGVGVGRGYHGDPARTAAAFVPDPCDPAGGGRLYRTGDLVVRRPDGVLEFLGRIDDQVKVRGFRIELGEVEAALERHPGVARAAVLAFPDARGEKRLAAYWEPAPAAGEAVPKAGEAVPPAGEAVPKAGELRQFLKSGLPDAMVPAAFVQLAAMPLTANGKVDRRALPEPDWQGAAGRPFLAVRDEIEELIAGLFARVLGRERVGASDDFFELGGHSLLATQVVARLRREIGLDLPLHLLFADPTPAGLAAEVRSLARAGQPGDPLPPLVPVPRGADLPLSFGQQRLWFLAALEPDSPAYNMPGAVRLRGPLRVAALSASLAAIVDRHEALRTSFRAVEGVPFQEVLPRVDTALPLLDLAALPAAVREHSAQAIAAAESRRPFALSRWPLFRTLLLRLREDDHLLLITLHHVVSDGWSQGVLVRELSALYGALSEGRAPVLPPLPVQYADFAVWQLAWLQGERLEAQLAYWRRALGGEPVALDLPLDRPRPPRRTYRGARLDVRVPAEPSLALLRRSRAEGGTPFMGLLALFAAELGRHSGQARIQVGSPIANRQVPELEELIGFFVNTLVFRVDLTGDPSFSTLLGRVRQVALGAYAHQDVPFELVVDDLQPERDLSRSPLFQTMFILQNAPAAELDLPGASLAVAELDNGTAKFELTLSLEEVGGLLLGWLEYNSDLFDRVTVERFSAHCQNLVAAAAERPGEPLSSLTLLGPAERAQLVVEWNDSRADLPGEPFVHTLVRAQAKRAPDALAVSAPDGHLTYGELAARSNRLAHVLSIAGVGPDVPVGIFAGRSLEAVVGLLGILTAGGAYLPLDPLYPAARLAMMLADAGAPVVVAQEHLAAALPEHRARVVPLGAAAAGAVGQGQAGDLAVPLLPEHVAYTLFTSGSTGRPKGVQVLHRGLANVLLAMAAGPVALGGRTVLSVTTLSFDIAGVEIFLPLSTGGRVVLADRETVLDGLLLAAAAEREQATLLQATPTTWRMLVESGWQGKADLAAITGGEALTDDLGERLRARVAVLWNGYGPTETAIYSIQHRVAAGRGGVSIGRPVANGSIHLLDRGLATVPIGVAGEICIGGSGIARGYAGRPDLTAERFIPDPVSGEPGARLYRTGDLASRRPDGRIDYLGRIDHQVKLRGFRIELPEIEAALESHPAVEQAVVVLDRTLGEPAGDPRLVAFLAAPGPDAPAAGELRALLRGRLPDYMIPSLFVRLDALPLTPNGKVDRRALPLPVAAPEGEREPAAAVPQSPVEEVLAGIFARVLERERIDVTDDFFDLGGHSLLATRVISRVNADLSVDLPVRSLFEAPTVAGLARAVAVARRGRRPLPPLERLPRDRPLPASFAQERLWVMERLAPGNAVYNVFQALRFTGPLAAATLERSLAEVIRRHETLRTRFETREGRPVQVIDPAPRFSLARIDLADLSPAVREGEVLRLAHAAARRPFELAVAPLLRASLLDLGGEQRVLLLTMHHIICDDWSIGLLVREVRALYEAFRQGLPSPLAELPVQYADYASWQRDWLQGEVLEEELAYWQRQLSPPLPALELPTDRPRPPRQSFRGAIEPFSLSGSLVGRLRQLGQQERTTFFMTLLAGLAAVLGHASGQEELVIGSPVAGRTRPEIEPLIGFFVNLLPLRIDLARRPTYRELLARVRRVALDAYGHQDLPFEKLVDALDPRRDPSRPAIRQVALSVQDTAMQPVALGEGIHARPIDIDLGVARLDLTLFVGADEEGLAGACEYDTALFDRPTVSRLLDFLRLTLEDMAADPGRQRLGLPPLIERAADLARGSDPLETNLTAGQLLFWFAPKLQPGVQLYFDRATTIFTMNGELAEDHFARAFRRLLDDCDTLRTRVVESGGLPQRVVGPAHPDALERLDLRAAPDPDAAFEQWIAARASRPIDLADKLFDSALVRLGPRRFAWFFNVHHIAADAGSLQTLARHLSELYRLSQEGRLDEARPLPSFEEYAALERQVRGTESYQKSRLYWEEKLSQPAGKNPFYRRPGVPFTTRTARISYDLSAAESERARELGSQSGAFSAAIVFTSALFALLFRTGDERRLRVGTSFANRPHRFRDVVGLMMNTFPLQIEVDEGETFRSLLRRVQNEIIDTGRHQHYPVRNPVEDRAYNVYVNYQTMSYTELCGLPVRFDLVSSEHSNDHLNVQVSDFAASGRFRIDLDFNETAFSPAERARTFDHFRNLLASLLADPEGRVRSAPMLGAAELAELRTWNAEVVALPRASVMERFMAQVARTPENLAASDRGERLTYRALAERADRLSQAIRRKGSGPEVPIALLAERGVEFLAAFLAILETGGVYLPLDPHHPPHRLAQVLEKSGAPLLLISDRQRRLASEAVALLPAGQRPRLLAVADLLDIGMAGAGSGLPSAPAAEGLAYILFTSGSTGAPKGVMVERSGMLNHLQAKIESLGLTAADVVAQNASQAFDISVWQLLAALLVGARVHVVADEVALDAARLLHEVAAEGVTVLEIVPSLLAVLLDAAQRRPGGPPALPTLRWLVPTGEALPPELCRRWLALYPGVPMLNAYGPTECSDDVTQQPIFEPPAEEVGTVPIGRPVPNVQIHLVDRGLGLLPVGLPGELCVGGVCVGRGYLGEPARTAEAFLPDPFAERPGARLYRTGDLARLSEEGALEFLGRIDHQVKIRGFRIELGEIESVLTGFPGVREVVLLAREDHPTDRRLVAYYVPEPGWGPTAEQLRGYLLSKLPEYMVPAAFVALPAMPLTANGKVDRRALPPPHSIQSVAKAERTAPRTPLESLIASICIQVLRVDALGVHDNFFDLGGNSLLATQVVAMLQEVLPIELDLRSLFEGPTVAKLADTIETGRSALGEQEQAVMAELLADFEQAMNEQIVQQQDRN
jgi:amino acid adenylation domain-containing protein